MRGIGKGLAVWALLVAGGASAQDATLPDAGASAQIEPDANAVAAGDTVVIPAGLTVEIAIDRPLDSKTTQAGNRFPILLAAPIVSEGRELLPAGVRGEGEVVHAERARAGGKAGEMILAARYLDCNGTRIALGYFRMGGAGRGAAGGSMAVGLVVPFGNMLVSGENYRVAKGALATARTRAETRIDVADIRACTNGSTPATVAGE